jgi:hypothetical protein
MENTKKICINDMGNKLYFKLHLFDVERGLDLADKLAGNLIAKNIKIRELLGELLPLVDMLDAKGDKVVKEGLSVSDCNSIFQNPLAVIELGAEVLKFQQVFIQNSALFQPLMKTLGNIWNTKTSELATA